MKRNIEHLGYAVEFTYGPHFIPDPNFKPTEANIGGMGDLIIAGTEYRQIGTQHPTLLKKLACDLEKIRTKELSCRKVIDVTYQSDLFTVFKNTSLGVCDVWHESFAREMANDASKSMTIDEIKACPALYCLLRLMNATRFSMSVTDVDTVNLRCITTYDGQVSRCTAKHCELTVNLDDVNDVKMLGKAADAPTFAENDLPAPQLAAK
jgi:hypothetical protein